MDIISPVVKRLLAQLRASEVNYEDRFENSSADQISSLRVSQNSDEKTMERIWQRLRKDSAVTQEEQLEIADPLSVEHAEIYNANIENYIGTLKMPMGVVGPINIKGTNAHGAYFAPMATTEAALIASYARGAYIVNKVGGAQAALLSEGVMRSPAFIFDGILDSGKFVNWVVENAQTLKSVAETTTRFGKLIAIEPFIDSDTVFLICRYSTGDASGQNMVTVATQKLCEYIEEQCPIAIKYWFIEANFSGDKKASFLGMYSGRGRKVTASVLIPEAVLNQHLHTSSERLLKHAYTASLGATLSGQLGVQAHYANALAAFYIATGQDAACVSESAVGFTRMEPRDDGVFFSVTLPNILVGTVGGGTSLPSQSAALSIVGLKGAGQAKALAELVAVLCLCGELSILGAISAGHFTHAHAKLARGR